MKRDGALVVATAFAGTLDLLSAFYFASRAGMSPVAVLAYVASGPFGDRALQGGAWAMAGAVVHFALMAIMVTVYLLAAANWPSLNRRPLLAGAVYGFLLWIVMYWIVKPLRWPEAPLPHTAYGIANALFSHCLMVGIPIALIASHVARQVPIDQPAA